MPRCKKKRECRFFEKNMIFKPMGCKKFSLNTVTINIDEFEAMRLCDHENKNQIEAGKIMGISRATIQRLLMSGRKKIINAFIQNNIIEITNKQ